MPRPKGPSLVQPKAWLQVPIVRSTFWWREQEGEGGRREQEGDGGRGGSAKELLPVDCFKLEFRDRPGPALVREGVGGRGGKLELRLADCGLSWLC
mmetsp:Transcript_106351/g.184907  ORF Transcript_106351/g.184907 Transcript_106351/m.184907 type:complete len:96 (+) Transcript_106351:275-562(+)